ncbi:hypothetical protein KQ940_11190 [Marinobacterium sp. D7]|uniref:hypothetical protein n=1 Tax=Marinobacterium ramblicola TaxID=2849041 RepID=UPI001C2D999F|nr:hypothetical protein [Marinobacterium ramblicola]MBV1788618.1 hypothetical protein [Marinobacterium ramblicola]
MAAQSADTRLPTAFVRQPAASAIRFKNRKELPFHRLPFVDGVPGRFDLSFWAVPKTGGYFGGNETGRALARIYMKHLKEHGASCDGSNLGRMVLEFDRKNGASAEQDVLRGQVVDFFTELEIWLTGAAKHLKGGLDKDDNKTLLKAANAGLNFDNEAYMATLDEEDEELQS